MTFTTLEWTVFIIDLALVMAILLISLTPKDSD